MTDQEFAKLQAGDKVTPKVASYWSPSWTAKQGVNYTVLGKSEYAVILGDENGKRVPGSPSDSDYGYTLLEVVANTPVSFVPSSSYHACCGGWGSHKQYGCPKMRKAA